MAGALSTVSKVARVLRNEGPLALAQRVVRIVYNRLGAADLNLPLFEEDVSDSSRLELPVPAKRPDHGRALRIGWIMTPPAPGSGGHTTLFRMIEAVEKAGHQCVIYLYDRYGGDINEQGRVVRQWWPGVRADICDARSGFAGVDAVVASSWESAHVLARRGIDPMRRLYFIQDYEPFFYPRGSIYALAEDSYRFGFRCIALGEMIAGLLRTEVGVSADVTEFGCDSSAYRLLPERPRSGVVFFARPDVPRRGYWLGRLALQRFHELHPDVTIHTYGAKVSGLPFPAIQHGRLTPTELNELYNSCIAGLVLSFTNISLVPEEMLAAGAIPVMNDAEFSKTILQNKYGVWAAPTPEKLAKALSEIVSRTDPSTWARAASASVNPVGWAKAQRDIVRILEEEVYGEVRPSLISSEGPP